MEVDAVGDIQSMDHMGLRDVLLAAQNYNEACVWAKNHLCQAELANAGSGRR